MLFAGSGSAAGGAADLDGLELFAAPDAAADVEHHFPDGCTHGHFDEACVHHVARQGKGLGARTGPGADGVVPIHAVADDKMDVGKCLHVVQHRGLRPQAVLNGSGRLDTGHPPVALDGGGQGTAFAADKGAGAHVHMDTEGEVCAHDVVAQQAVFLRLGDSGLQAADGQGIFGADIDIALITAHAQARDHHALQHAVGVALHNRAVHERAGVALIAVADHILLLCLLPPGAFPLAARGESAAAPAPETGVGDGLADLLVSHFKQGLFKAGVAALGDILLNILGIAAAAVLQYYPVLALVEGNVLLAGIGHAIQVVHQPVDDLAAQDSLFDDLVAVLRLNMNVHDAHGFNMDQGAHFAEAVAAAHLDMEALLLVCVMLEAHINSQAPLFALGLDVVVNFQSTAGNAAGTGTNQDRGHLLALLQSVPGVGLEHMEAVSCHLRSGSHTAASFLRMSSSSSSAASGVILAWTSPSTVMTGANPQAPRHATVSRVNSPSAEVFFLSVRPR